MNPQYLEKLTDVLQQARPGLPRSPSLQFKPSFGAVAAYMDGRIFASCGKFGLALKLPPERCAELIGNKSAGPLRYFPNGHVKKSYAVLSAGILEDPAHIAQLIAESMAFVSLKGS